MEMMVIGNAKESLTNCMTADSFAKLGYLIFGFVWQTQLEVRRQLIGDVRFPEWLTTVFYGKLCKVPVGSF